MTAIVPGGPIYVDIDGTMTHKKTQGGTPNKEVIALVINLIANGTPVVVWSGGGRDYVKQFCRRHNIAPVAMLGKPNAIIDDCPTIRPDDGRMPILTPVEFLKRYS